jgi:hypothetical protein
MKKEIIEKIGFTRNIVTATVVSGMTELILRETDLGIRTAAFQRLSNGVIEVQGQGSLFWVPTSGAIVEGFGDETESI